MKKYSCKYCNYQTDLMYNYSKHTKTIKHHKNIKKNDGCSLSAHFCSLSAHQNSDAKTETHLNLDYSDDTHVTQIPYDEKNTDHEKNCSLFAHFCSLSAQKSELDSKSKFKFECINCKYKTNRKSNYKRHSATCVLKNNSTNMSDTDEKPDRLKNIIELQNQHINELKTKNKLDVLSTENKLLKEHTKHITNSAIIGNNNTTNIQNITQYIKNTFPNAPNVKTIERIENIEKYIGYNCTDSYASLIHDYYLKDVEPKDRSVWLVDSARDKYLTRLNNNWKIDVNGEEFCKLVNKALSKALYQGQDQISDNRNQMSLVLLELVIHVANQSKMPKTQKSQFLIQNIVGWKELGSKLIEKKEND